MEEPLSQSDIELRNAIIRIIKMELAESGDLTYAMNKIIDKRYDHRRDLERQLKEAKAKVRLIELRIATDERFGNESV